MKRTSTEAHVYMRRHQGAKTEHFDVSNVIYHKFSHSAVFYILNGEYVNVMLEFFFILQEWYDYNLNLVRFDSTPMGFSPFGQNPLTQIHDFNTGKTTYPKGMFFSEMYLYHFTDKTG